VGSLNGNARRNKSLIKVKMAVFIPIATARVKIAERSEGRRFAQLSKSKTDVVHKDKGRILSNCC